MEAETRYHPNAEQRALAGTIEESLAPLLPLSRLHASHVEDAGTWASLDEIGQELLELLSGQRALTVRADRTLALVRLLQMSPSLRARELESRQRLREKVADAIGRRLGLDHHIDMRPRLLAGIALVPLDVAITMWLDRLSSESVHAILDTSIATLAGALAEMHSPSTAPDPNVWRSHE